MPYIQELKFYEEVLVLHPDSSETEQKEVFQSLAKIVEASKGKIYNVDTWGSRPIANQGPKKVSRGFYFHAVFSTLPSDIQEIRRLLKINNRVVYFHHEKLNSKTTPESHLENFKADLEDTLEREKDRQARLQKKQSSGMSR